MTKPLVTASINNNPVQAIIDTGASVMLMSLNVVNKMQPRPQLQSRTIYAYGSTTPIEVIGSFTACIGYKSSSVTTPVFVTTRSADTLLNFATASALGLVNIAYNLESGPPTATPDFFATFADCFQGKKVHRTPSTTTIGDIMITSSLHEQMPPEPPEQFIRHNPPRNRQPPAYLQDYVP